MLVQGLRRRGYQSRLKRLGRGLSGCCLQNNMISLCLPGIWSVKHRDLLRALALQHRELEGGSRQAPGCWTIHKSGRLSITAYEHQSTMLNPQLMVLSSIMIYI